MRCGAQLRQIMAKIAQISETQIAQSARGNGSFCQGLRSSKMISKKLLNGTAIVASALFAGFAITPA